MDGKQIPSKGVRLVHILTKLDFGVYFQAQVRSMEWKAAYIVHDKYRRKYNLAHEDLVSLREFAEDFSAERKRAGKSLNKDFLIQELSAELKRRVAAKGG